MKTMKNLKMSYEILQTLTSQDQHPVHKDHRPVPALRMNPLTTTTSTEKENLAEQYKSARSHDSGRTVLYPDLYDLTLDEYWTMTPEAHKSAAAAGVILFCDLGKWRTAGSLQLDYFPCVQRSLCLDEVTNDSSSTQDEVSKGVDSRTRDMLERCMATCGKAAGARAKRRSRTRREASAQEVRKYYKQIAEPKHLEYNSRVDNEVLDLIDMRKVKPKTCVTGRRVLTINTDKHGNILRAKARWVLRGFQDNQKDYQQTDSPASRKPRFRMSCQMTASTGGDLLHIDLKTAFL